MAATPARIGGTEVPPDIDIHTTSGKLADLGRRIDEAVHAGSAKAVEKRHTQGRKTARERIGALLDEGSFVELDQFARHRCRTFNLRKNRPYGDGVVTGYGAIDGRQVCVFAQDFTVFGGSLGEVFGEKIVKMMDPPDLPDTAPGPPSGGPGSRVSPDPGGSATSSMPGSLARRTGQRPAKVSVWRTPEPGQCSGGSVLGRVSRSYGGRSAADGPDRGRRRAPSRCPCRRRHPRRNAGHSYVPVPLGTSA
jgi:hypothetical protein